LTSGLPVTRRRRPDATPEEKAHLLTVVNEIRAEEPELSVRAYMYRIWSRQDVYLHGDLCSKSGGPGCDQNEESIQRRLLEFRGGPVAVSGAGSAIYSGFVV
jgi:hypothetical protein